jgi:hypothetical protein
LIEQLVGALRGTGVSADWRDLADVLWLATVQNPVEEPNVAVGDSPPDEQMADPAPGAPALDVSHPPAPAETAPPASPVGSIQPVRGAPHQDSGDTRRRAGGGGAAGLQLSEPANFALPGRQDIGRALRPLKRRHPSRREQVFDADATVGRFCETGILQPVFTPARERWFDVTVVVDESPTMAPWTETAAAFADLLERHGAFGRVDRRHLRVTGDDVQLTGATGVEANGQDLTDTTARRIVLVLSDCIDPVWRGDVVWARLREWGRAGPVALVQLLPERLWPLTALGAAEIAISSDRPGRPNARVTIEQPWWASPDAPIVDVIPVLSLDEQSLSPWARFMTGESTAAIVGVEATPPPVADEMTVTADTPERRLAIFRATASPAAYRLAVWLSAIEVSLPLARILLDRLAPGARQSDLAEVVSGGILRRTSTEGEPLELDFVDGVRELLQQSLTIDTTIDVWRAVTPYLELTGDAPQFSLLLAGDQDSTAATGEHAPASALTQIAADLIERLGIRRPAPEPAVAHVTPPSPVTPSTLRRLQSDTIGTFISVVAGPSSPVDGENGGPHWQPDEVIRALAAGYDVVKLTEPSSEEVLHAIDAAAATTESLVVVWSGHCYSNEGVLVLTTDTGADGANFVSPTEIARICSRSAAAQVLLILDVNDAAALVPGCLHELEHESPRANRWVGVFATNRATSDFTVGDFDAWITDTLLNSSGTVATARSARDVFEVLTGYRSSVHHPVFAASDLPLAADPAPRAMISFDQADREEVGLLAFFLSNRGFTVHGESFGYDRWNEVFGTPTTAARTVLYVVSGRDARRSEDPVIERLLAPPSSIAELAASALPETLVVPVLLGSRTSADQPSWLAQLPALGFPEVTAAAADAIAARIFDHFGIDRVALLEETVAAMERSFGPYGSKTLDSRTNLALAYLDAARTKEGVALLERVVTESARTLGPDHVDTLARQKSLASAYLVAGELTRVVSLLETVAATQDRLFGADSPSALATREQLVGAYLAVDKVEPALATLQSMVDVLVQARGVADPETSRLIEKLAELGELTGRNRNSATWQPPTAVVKGKPNVELARIDAAQVGDLVDDMGTLTLYADRLVYQVATTRIFESTPLQNKRRYVRVERDDNGPKTEAPGLIVVDAAGHRSEYRVTVRDGKRTASRKNLAARDQFADAIERQVRTLRYQSGRSKPK